MKRSFCLLLLPLLALAGSISRTFTFDASNLVFSRANGFDIVELAGHNMTLEVGKPMLPEAVFNLLIPANATVTSVTVDVSAPEPVAGSYRIHPAQEPVPLSSRASPAFVPPDPATYASTRPYPVDLVNWAQTCTKSGWRICPLALHPLVYIPADGTLMLHRRMTVTVNYTEGNIVPPRLSPRQYAAFAADVSRLVANPEDVVRFAPAVRESDNLDCDYAIITSSSLASNFQPLATWRTKRGLYARVFRVDSIASVYPGRDNQEKIRNFIIDYFQNHGLTHVLLAGDHSIVPSRRGRVVVGSETGNIPTDCYYGDLQWSWDGDRDNIFGEMDQDTVDLFYDVFIGRASVDNTTQANTFVNKVLFYEKTPTTDYLNRYLGPYVLLWPEYSGRIVNETIANKTPSGWRDALIEPSSTNPMRDSINVGYHICHVAAHGDDYGFYTQSGTPIYTTSVAGSQTNSTRPVILNSIACISGNFETEDCLAEALMNNPNGGAVACIMNSRYGWGTPPQMGPSERLDCMFYDYYFLNDTVEIGRNHCGSKGVYVYSALSQAVWRWCYYALNLFGDPDMPMWLTAPGTMTATNRDTTATGAQTFSVTVTSGGSPVVGALVCLYKPGEVHEVGRTGSGGSVNITINPLTTGTMYLTVTCKQKLPLEKTVAVVQGTPRPYISIQSVYIDDGGNHQLEPGEAADVYVTLRNIGNAQATSVQGYLRTASGYIALNDSTSNYGTINAGDTSRGDRYRVTAASGTPPGTVVSFTTHVTSEQGSWDPTFQITIGTPPQPGAVFKTHDTGYCKLSVTANGGIGFTEPPSLDLGVGFCYPKSAASQLFYSSLLIGNSTTWVADHFFGNPPSGPPNADFRLFDSVRAVIPPRAADQHFRSVFTDAAHSAPKQLKITQNSYQVSSTGYDDFVILTFDILNNGSSSVNGLYAGVWSDFDIGSNPASNTSTADTVRRLMYMRQSSSANPTVGVKILFPHSFRNLTSVDHARYVYPDSCVTDNQKFRFLNGTIVQRNSNRAYDWSVVNSVGPFDLAVGQTYHFAVAFVGGTSEAICQANADSAQSWYDRNVGVREEGTIGAHGFARLTCVPNPFSGSVRISYQVPAAGRVRVEVFDVSGRSVATLIDAEQQPGNSTAIWNAHGLAAGIYLVRATLPGGASTDKLMLLR